ncbi:MAG TPA: hypothetical protein VH518_11780 [Tepidisphaeraceae bacterium]
MNLLITLFARCVLSTALGTGLLAAILTMVPRLGSPGRRLGEAFARAPMLDLWVAMLTWVPWVIMCWVAGWIGLAGALVGQMISLATWCWIHELMHREALHGPRIVKFINRAVGRWQNHLALWVTLVALPGFWFIRMIQITAYWPLVVLLGFPSYKHSEWINVSRQKFDGLIGHDLVWCLYCDWMTGVYSLGAEMLRNVESFWCPIRYYDGKKCENCRVDFPDIEHGWVAAEGNMHDVERVMQEKYGDGRREWFGHPARLTVNGKPIEPAQVEAHV